jgi:hypothetical protein
MESLFTRKNVKEISVAQNLGPDPDHGPTQEDYGYLARGKEGAWLGGVSRIGMESVIFGLRHHLKSYSNFLKKNKVNKSAV